MKTICQILFLLSLAVPCSVQAQIISTYAGGGAGDGHPATAVGMSPFGVCADGSGNVYIADINNNRVLKVNASGMLSAFAGTGSPGYTTDGIAATASKLKAPTGVVADASGNVYIADKGNGLIRKVSVSGIITTYAGGGSTLGDGGPATDAFLNFPFGIALDASGNLYIADELSYRVRKVSAAGIITTFAGTGTSGFGGDGGAATAAMLQGPSGVAVDASGNVYIADITGKRIRKVNATGTISTYAGNGTAGMTGDGGPATAAEMYNPVSVAVDNSGNVYSSDESYGYVRKINSSGIINTIAGGGGLGTEGIHADSAELYSTSGVAFDATGNMFVVDQGQYRVRKVNTSNIINTIAGLNYPTYIGDGGSASACGLQMPADLANDGAGNLYVVDEANNRIRKISAAGTITTLAGNDTVGFTGDGGPATGAQLHDPIGIAVDGVGNVYFSDRANERIRKISTTGIITTIAGTGTTGFSGDGGPATAAMLAWPYQMTVDRHGNLFFADEGNNRVRKINTSGVITTIAGCSSSSGFGGDGAAATAAHLSFPTGVAVDTFGNVYIADMGNNRVRKVDLSGIISTYAGSASTGYSGDSLMATDAEMYEPTGIKADSAGNLYVADWGNNRVRMINASSGMIYAVAGTWSGYGGYSGDGGPATAAQLYQTSGIAFDGCNSIYIADEGNNVIRKVTLIAPILGTASVCAGSVITLSDSTTSGTWHSSAAGVCTVSSSGVVTGISSGASVISYTAANSCGTAYTSVPFTVNPLPVSGTVTGGSTVCTGTTITLSDTASGGTWSSIFTGIATIASTGVVTGVTPGVDTIRYSVSNSCGTVRAAHMVTVITVPAVSAITGPDTLCAAHSMTLTDTTATGSWSTVTSATVSVSGSGVVTGLAGGSGIIKYAVANVCGTTAVYDTITINPEPVAGTITGTSIIDSATSATLSETATGGTWSSSNTTVATVNSSGVVTGVSSGTATISYTVANGCDTLSATFVVTIINPSGVTATGSAAAGLLLFPNPATEQLTIITPDLSNDWHLVITDVSGRVVSSENYYTPKIMIKPVFEPGLYMVKLTNNKTQLSYTGKFVRAAY